MQTKDYRELPGGYGMGSGTLVKWIQDKLDADMASASANKFGALSFMPKLKEYLIATGEESA